MKKRSILDENYMALEQNLATVLDDARERLLASERDANERTEKALGLADNGVISPDLDAKMINFRAELGLERSVADVDSKLVDIVKKIKNAKSIPLDKSAYLSVAMDHFKNEKVDDADEVQKAVNFFGSKDNVDIPDARDNIFNVSISDAGRREAIQKMIELRDIFDGLKVDLLSDDQEKFKESVKKLAIFRDLAEKILEN